VDCSRTTRASSWHYGLADPIPVLDCSTAMAMVCEWYRGQPATRQVEMGLKSLSQVEKYTPWDADPGMRPQ
jgi:hypothetical protein